MMGNRITLWAVLIYLAVGLNEFAAADHKANCVPPPPDGHALNEPNMSFCNSAELASLEKLKVARIVLEAGDARAAIDIWHELAKENNMSALKSLGLMGVTRDDYVMATKWYRKAADLGDADAQRFMGDSYFHGKGAPQDYVLAYMWYSLSASHAVGSDQTKSTGVAELRDLVAAKMSKEQIAEAQNLTRSWVSSK